VTPPSQHQILSLSEALLAAERDHTFRNINSALTGGRQCGYT